jgi:asparagine synthase (glutamine-hydrolysing)
MGALVAVIDLRGEPLGERPLASLFASLVEAPGDGDSAADLRWAALGCRAFWVTREERGERQPIVETGRYALLFDGRLDDREHLLGLLPRECAEPPPSDAALVAALLATRGWDILPRLLGSWALAWLDLQRRELHLARDPMGGRPLSWRRDGRRVWLASEEAALAAAGDLSVAPDERALATLFLGTEMPPDATFFADVQQVPAGVRLTVSEAGERRAPFWEPPQAMLRLRSEDEYVERYRELLTAAVAARLRSYGRAAVLMSGGLDSTTLAALAAGFVTPLPVVSWRFANEPRADEGEYLDAMVDASRLEPHWVAGDDCWTLRDTDLGAVDPNVPGESTFRFLHQRAYAAALNAGARALLSGHFADELYLGARLYWLRDAVARGRPGVAARELGRAGGITMRHWGHRHAPRYRALFARLVLGKSAETLRKPRPEPWMRREAWPLVTTATRSSSGLRPPQVAGLLAPAILASFAAERRRTRGFGVQLMLPYRDRRIVELAMALPADLLSRPGRPKYLSWKAAQGLLPEAVRQRRRPTTLEPLFWQGVLERERPFVEDLLLGVGPKLWERYVELAPLRAAVRGETGNNALPAWVVWRCIAAELWARRLKLSNPSC